MIATQMCKRLVRQAGGELTYLNIMKYPSLFSARQSLPNSVLILAPHMWGASPKDRWMWMAEKNGEVLDYDAKWCLIRDYLKTGDEVYVLTCHKDGTVTAKKQ